jgi:hypothetical protein
MVRLLRFEWRNGMPTSSVAELPNISHVDWPASQSSAIVWGPSRLGRPNIFPRGYSLRTLPSYVLFSADCILSERKRWYQFEGVEIAFGEPFIPASED